MPKYPLLFLIGLHGVGKSTLGRNLAAYHGYRHISLGDLGRLLRSRRIPRDYSTRFLRLLAAHEPGERMAPDLIAALQTEIERHNALGPLVVDGFPTEPYHIMGLPAGCTVIHLHCDDQERARRLSHRSETTKRKWSDSMESRRDRQLQAVFDVAIERSDIAAAVVSAHPEPEAIAADIAAKLGT